MIFKHNGHSRNNTPESINRKIELETEARIRYLSLRGKNDIDKRLHELDTEWDLESVSQLKAGSLVLAGILMAAIHNKKWLLLSGFAGAFLIQHSLLGWSLPVSLFRFLRIRTRTEIEKEKIALMAIRGDFHDASFERDNLKRADKAIKAIIEK
jgi:hypothetical protein